MKKTLSCYRLRVVEYYDKLVNEIDLKAETFLADETYADQAEECEAKRTQFLAELKRVELLNLKFLETNSLETNSSDESIFQPEFCFLVSAKDLRASKKNWSTTDSLFGYLITTDRYLSDKNLASYRQLLFFSSANGVQNQLDINNKLFELIDSNQLYEPV